MAATDPRRDTEESQERPDRPRGVRPDDQRGAIGTVANNKRSIWFWVIVGIVVLAVVAAIAYFALYSGGGYSSGGGGGSTGGGGGGGGGGYFIVALSADQLRRVANRVRSRK